MKQHSKASAMHGLCGTTMNVKVAAVLAKLPHVTVATPAAVQMTTQGSVELIYGIDYESFNALKPVTFLDGGKFQGPNDVLIDDVMARTEGGHKEGDNINTFDHTFRIAG